MKFIGIVIILLLPVAAQAACWRELYSDPQIDLYMNDCSSVQAGTLKKSWFRRVYLENRKVDDYKPKEYDETKSLVYFNCSARTAATVQIIFYGPEPANDVITSWNIDLKNASFTEVVPDSFGEFQLEAACKK